ncbi:branched-chain amino acid ABC transporter substrate-binding protein [Petrotoga mexicana DSM 14811]|uniref:Branched-chain amino acid ABC transporter substrate-binding protein n=1 Tax=Petrotoga mexicana DSM 14811 TaxID=1122954 RepID=A0A2K1P763_9BACT|nr:ABC transporter substrate-binding protein [Petrotoga mexicana]PNR98638.1 branched-chain amino acid ABC transporter substrate-binding protein [Petrotoga mexicana DSM 14811]
MRKTFVMVFLVILMTFTLFSQEVIKIGMNFELTGPVSGYGQMSRDGVLLANKLKPTVNIGGKEIKVEVVAVDNKSDKAEAANAIRRLIDHEKVVAVIGPATSSAALAAASIAEERQIPMVVNTATNPLVAQNKKYVFRTCFEDTLQGALLATFAWEELGAKNVAIMIDVAQDYVVGLANYFEKAFEQFGGTYFTEFYTTGDQDFTAQLTDALSKNPDAIFMPGYYAEIALICKQARDLGFTGPMFAGDGADAPELIQIGGEYVEGVSYTTYFHEDADLSPATKPFVEAYQKEYNRRADAFGALAYDAYMVIVNAIESAQSTDPVKIRDALAKTKNFPGVAGTITYPEGSGNPIKPAVINMVENGQFVFRTVIKPSM